MAINYNFCTFAAQTILITISIMIHYSKTLKQFIVVVAAVQLFSCMEERKAKEDDSNVISKFNSTWNIHERCQMNDDGTITYKAVEWGGLVGNFLDKNLPVDLSAYESITFEFAEPTTVPTQIVVADRFKTWGKEGIQKLTCYFDGQDVTAVDKILLQTGDTCTLTIKKAFLMPNDVTWVSTNIWEGECDFGDWENGFVVKADKFENAEEGDQLEFIFKSDTSNPEITYWHFKTIYDDTSTTLEGNENELNNWGCAYVGPDATVYRIRLTANDVANLKEKGLFVNGFHVIVSKANLVSRSY